ncbi:MAG TPA: ferrous iron transport protein B [Spirochaetales bacterium]|nr:ferrous iron transport protein B [Spirochaetales bacterium]HPG85923.1 ferrous iron transport protein B [Spirochaetales bacterium]
MRDDTSAGAKGDLRIALAGNPNAGKTTIFNALTGAHHKVGNYPGVTVEKREGSRSRNGRRYDITDLPGIYSLTAYSIDEVVTRDFLLDHRPDIIVDVMDSTNLSRHLYLCLQFQELGIPVIGALNMSDEAAAKGIRIDEKALGEVLGIPMIKTVGPKGSGMDDLLDAIDRTADTMNGKTRKEVHYGAEIEEKLAALEAAVSADAAFIAKFPARWLAVKLLEKDEHAFEKLAGHVDGAMIAARAKEASAWIDGHFGKDAEIVMSEQRYGYIRGAVKEAITIEKKPDFSLTEAIDKVVMNRFLALPIFVGVLWSVFQITFALGEYPMAWFESLFAWLGEAATTIMPDGFLRSLVVDGIIGGVGGVFSFVPLIVILFFLLSLLEDIGYMSRAAFATDKILHTFGLHGQSVFPMMLGFGCSVPAIMAARTLKSPRDRIVTILVIPFMSCGAKLPVHVLLAAAFFPNNAGNMVMLIYAIGVLLALGSAWLLKKTVLRGEATPFVMELPPYRAPTVRGVLWHVWEKTWHYIQKAGTIILASSVLIWAVTTFPSYEPTDSELASAEATFLAGSPGATDDEVAARLETVTAELALANSAAGTFGRFIEPVFRPLGFDWKLGVATVTGFAAKEVVVSTLGVLYSVGTEESEESEGLREALRNDPNWTPLLAFVMMLFTLVIPPCFAALAAIKAELGWKWLGFAFAFMLGLGWALGAAIYQIGSLAGLA